MRYHLTLLAALVLSASANCTGDVDEPTPSNERDETGSPPAGSFHYSGPGSYWEADFDAQAGTFVITMAEMPDSPVLMTVEGTYADQNGFKTLTVSQATGQDAPAPGDQALGLELPGYAFLLLPLDEEHDGIIPMLVSGACPTNDQSLNWLMAQGYAERDASDPTREFFGTYSYAHAQGVAEVPARYALAGTTLLSSPAHPIAPGACSGSVMTIADATQTPIADMWMTQGGAMVRTYDGDANQTILALPGDPVTASELAGDWVGLHFTSAPGADAGLTSGVAESMPVAMTIDANGQGSGAAVVDVATGTLAAESMSLSLDQINVPSAGWVTGAVSSSEGSGALACAAATGVGLNGQSILFCIGQNPTDPTRAFTLMLASKP